MTTLRPSPVRPSCLNILFALGLALAGAGSLARAADFPPAPAPTEAEKAVFGVGVQRTMALLAGSTPERRNKVRILFYGQSITEQPWWKLVAEDLRKRFPHADLTIENRAIGGFASQLLKHTAEQDVIPFYPDLVIFHVYGANGDYEEIIRGIRSRTTAEVLLQKDHVGAKWPAEKPDQKADKGLWWDHMMNNVFLPDIAKKCGCGIVDVRGPWVAYLKANGLQPKALLKDDVHLNDHGCFLMAELVKRYLVHRPEVADPASAEAVKTLEVGKDIQAKDGKLTVAFDGNRVDVVLAAGKGSVAVTVDGKKPSAFAECWAATRATWGPDDTWFPAVAPVRVGAPAADEIWTLRITEPGAFREKSAFEVTGSKTGPDGAGDTKSRFVSKSGRIVLEPGDWYTAFTPYGKKPFRAGFEIKWKTFLTGADEAAAAESGGKTVTVVQGIPVGTHTLELTGEGLAAVRAVVIHRPPLSTGKSAK
jgi:hypothetical protein